MDRRNRIFAVLAAALVIGLWLTVGTLGGWTMVDVVGWCVVEGGFSLALGTVALVKLLLILVSVASLGLQTIAHKAV